MDEKDEDKSDESFQKHLIFYKQLNETISGIQDEIKTTSDEKLVKHLNERIKAIELDKKRIRQLFSNVDEKTWNDLDKKN